MIDKPGSYRISEVDYHADNLCSVPSLSRGTIKRLVMQTPRHAWYAHPRLNPNFKAEEKDIFDMGKAAHALFLEGLDKAVVVAADSWRTKEAKEAKDKAHKEGKIPLLFEQYGRIKTMVGVAHESLANSELAIRVEDGDSELSYLWTEHETQCKIRPDWISDDRTIILDYKTTGQLADPETYVSIITSTGLDIQDAFYGRGVNTIERSDPRFYFFVQETSEPYLCSLISLDEMFKDMGAQKVHKGIELWRRCMSTGKWPGYPRHIYTVEPRPWALSAWEMRQAQL